MFFMFIFATEKIKEMKKTILFSILSVLTFASAWAVSYPDQGLMLSNSSEEEFVYLPGAGNFRNAEQVGHRYYIGGGSWIGTWGETSGDMTAEDAMGMTPREYASKYYSSYGRFDGSTYYWMGPNETPEGVIIGGSPTDFNNPNTTLNELYTAVLAECLSKTEGKDELACQNYAVDVYNNALDFYNYSTGDYAVFLGYFSVPVSTDMAFMALMLAAYLGFAAYRKKHFLAKA